MAIAALGYGGPESAVTHSELVHGLVKSAEVAVMFGRLYVVLAKRSHGKQQ